MQRHVDLEMTFVCRDFPSFFSLFFFFSSLSVKRTSKNTNHACALTALNDFRTFRGSNDYVATDIYARTPARNDMT